MDYNWNPPRRRNPSFSSSLLDENYRSIDNQTPTTEADISKGQKYETNYFGLNSRSTTSSDSCSFWTSSDSETSKSKVGLVRTSFCSDNMVYVSQGKLKNECGGFVKPAAKSKTLKKSQGKQPVSPASRLANFLNSLFTKKSKIQDERKYNSDKCLSKTKLSHEGSKRFHPVVIMEEYGRKGNIIERRRNYDDNIPARNSVCGEEIRENNRRAREVLKNFQKKIQEEEEDCESCASSDLFELHNLDEIERYCEELPVYETTSLDANRAIAHATFYSLNY